MAGLASLVRKAAITSRAMTTKKMRQSMKRIMKTLALVAVAAMGLTACQNEYDDEQIVANDSVVVTFVADAADDTRTSVDTSGEKPAFAWGDNETFAVLEQTDDALAEATSVTFTKEDGKAKIEAEFAANAGKGSYNYVTIYPESGYVTGAASINEATLSLPAAQTMAESSYDPAADLMVSEVVNTTAQPTEAQMVGFTRLAAVAKMTLKNLALETGDEVESVTFTADGKVLAGTFTTDLATPAVADAEGSNSVTIATTSSNVVYFTVLPTEIAVGGSFTVTVVTNRYIYVKQVTIPEGKKALTFQAGKVTRFSVNMQGVAPSDKWVLVKDASTLAEGDVVIIATNGLISSTYYAMSTTQNTNYRGYTEIAKYNDFVINPSNSVQQFTLVKRYEDKVAFDFYDGVNKGFIYAASSGNRYLKTQPYYDNNTLFYIEVDNTGVATVTAKDSEYSYNQLMFYDSSYSDYFACVGSTKAKPISLYKLVGAPGEVPVVAAYVTVSGDDVVITEDGAAEATAISTELVKFNYVGDWTINASATEKDSKEPATWLTLAYDAVNNCLTYTAEKNNDAKREATITITASLEGQNDLTWTVNVIQKGAPQDITIKAFGDLIADENSTYRLTGKVVTCATNASTSGYFLADENGNQAQIVYLKTENDEDVWGHDDFTLQLGDIVTVTAVPAGSKKGGSKTNPAIYKGHYRLTATAGIAADYTGGDVTIEVETSSNGNVILPTTPVKGTMSDYDFADFAYTDGSDTATVTFNSENTTSEAREAEVTFTYGLASTTISVQQGINPANKKGYELVTDASTLAVGDEVIIVAVGSNKALGCLASTASATGVSTIPAVDIEKTGTVVFDAEEKGVMLLTLKAGLNDDEFAFQFTHKDVNYYINAPSSGLKGRAASSGANNSTSYAITIDAATGVATVQSTYPRIVKFNSKTGTNFTAFKLDAEGATLEANHIAIYKKQK